MGVKDMQYGDDIYGYLAVESSFGVGVIPSATDAFRAVSLVISHSVNRTPVNDRRDTRSLMETFEGRAVSKWSVSMLLRPSGTLGIAPECAAFLKLALGSETTVVSTSVNYTLLKDATGLYYTLIRKNSTTQQNAYTCIITDWSIKFGGDEPMMLTFNGEAVGSGETAPCVTVGAGAPDTALIVDDADLLSKYGIIEVDDDDTPNLITALNHTTQTATISSATWGNNDVVAPMVAAPTFSGSDPLYGSDGRISFDGDVTPIKVLGGTINGQTGHSLLNTEYGSDVADDVTLKQRAVNFDMNIIVKEDEVQHNSNFQRKVAQNVWVTLGDTAASRAKAKMIKAEVDPGEFSSPETGEIEYSISSKALGTSGEDEFSLLFD